MAWRYGTRSVPERGLIISFSDKTGYKKMYKNRKIVVVMPAYNAEKTIVKTFAEVMDQDIVDQVIVGWVLVGKVASCVLMVDLLTFIVCS